jgi:hypothetical protein
MLGAVSMVWFALWLLRVLLTQREILIGHLLLSCIFALPWARRDFGSWVLTLLTVTRPEIEPRSYVSRFGFPHVRWDSGLLKETMRVG